MKIGDVVAKVTKAVGIEPCDACKERQQKLNDIGDWLGNLFGGENVEASGKLGPPGNDHSGSGTRGAKP